MVCVASIVSVAVGVRDGVPGERVSVEKDDSEKDNVSVGVRTRLRLWLTICESVREKEPAEKVQLLDVEKVMDWVVVLLDDSVAESGASMVSDDDVDSDNERDRDFERETDAVSVTDVVKDDDSEGEKVCDAEISSESEDVFDRVVVMVDDWDTSLVRDAVVVDEADHEDVTSYVLVDVEELDIVLLTRSL